MISIPNMKGTVPFYTRLKRIQEFSIAFYVAFGLDLPYWVKDR